MKCIFCNDLEGVIECSVCKEKVCDDCWKTCRYELCPRVVCHKCKSESLRDRHLCTAHRN